MVDSAEMLGTFSERLDLALRTCGLSNRDFAARVDAERGQQIVNNWRKRGRIGWPSVSLVNEIFEGQIDMLWLNEGKGSPSAGGMANVFADRSVKLAQHLGQLADAQQGDAAREAAGVPSVGPSQPARIDPVKLNESVRFLEQQFALWGRDFVASERTYLIAAVYDALTADGKSNLVSLSQWLAQQLSAEDSNVGQGEAGSAGGNDRKRAQGGS